MTAPVPAGPTDAQAELREAWARKLFHEFVTGLPSAWTSDHGQNAHYRTECYRVVDELLADVRDALAAQEAVKRVEELHKPVMNWTSPECETCSTFDDDCSRIASWPCPTARALDGDSWRSHDCPKRPHRALDCPADDPAEHDPRAGDS